MGSLTRRWGHVFVQVLCAQPRDVDEVVVPTHRFHRPERVASLRFWSEAESSLTQG
jgi:hypothetical protein